jgi:ankyrin repeat protein
LWQADSPLPEWLETGSGIFAVTGKPGSGKSMLMYEVSTQVRKRYRDRFAAIVQHIFNTRGTPREHSFDGFLRSAIVQLLRQYPTAFDAMSDDWTYVAGEAGLSATALKSQDLQNINAVKWPLLNLKRALRAIIGHICQKSRIFILIDALDECDGAIDTAEGLIGFIKNLVAFDATGSANQVSWMLSCRDLPNGVACMLPLGFRMEERNGPDIAAYISDRWSVLNDTMGESDELQRLKKNLNQRADGVFLWVRLTLDRIQTAVSEGATISEVQDLADDIPDELEGVFRLFLENTDSKHSVEAHMMLAIALCAQRPLELQEFRYVMALAADQSVQTHKDLEASRHMVKDDAALKRRIRSRCGGLLEVRVVDGASDLDDTYNQGQRLVVQFIHQSVRDYIFSVSGLRDSQRKETRDDRMLSNGHVLLSRCSVRYLAFPETQDFAWQCHDRKNLDRSSRMSLRHQLPFLHYAAMFCFSHLSEAEITGTPQAEVLEQFFGSGQSALGGYISLFNAFRPDNKYPQGYDLLQLAVHHNLASFVDDRLSESSIDIDATREGHQTLLQEAVMRKHKETVQVLLAHGADVSLGVLSLTSFSYWTLFTGPGQEDFIHGHLPLVLACANGNAEIVRILLENGAEPSQCQIAFPLGFGYVAANLALMAAVYSGDVETLKTLLDWDPATFAHPSIRFRGVLGLLYSFRREVHVRSASKLDAYDWLTHMEKASPALKLLCSGIDLESHMVLFGQSKLFWMLTGCRYEVLERLAQQGADFSEAYSLGLAFIHAACMLGTVASVQFLLRNHAKLETTGDDENSCLHFSVWNSQPAVLSYLLEIGLPVNTMNRNSETALHAAAYGSTDDFIEVLLMHKADRRLASAHGLRPFHLAIFNHRLRDHIGILEKLICDKSDVHLADRDGHTALHIAAGCGLLRVVRWLLEKGADVSPCDGSGRTALQLAASSRSSESQDVLSLLILEGSDVNHRDSADMTALHHAFWTYDEIVHEPSSDPDLITAKLQLLLQAEADVAARDNAGNTPLHFAAWRGTRQDVRLLLRHGASPFAKDVNGLRPLDLAKIENMRELLEQAMAKAEQLKK